MVIGDVLRCLFVSCRLFLALVFVVNVLVWFFVDDDDNDEAVDGGARGRPVRENPEGQPSTNTTGSGRAPCVRSLCGFWACRRTAQPPPPPTPPPSRVDARRCTRIFILELLLLSMVFMLWTCLLMLSLVATRLN